VRMSRAVFCRMARHFPHPGFTELREPNGLAGQWRSSWFIAQRSGQRSVTPSRERSEQLYALPR
jgi:hypothetical protein